MLITCGTCKKEYLPVFVDTRTNSPIDTRCPFCQEERDKKAEDRNIFGERSKGGGFLYVAKPFATQQVGYVSPRVYINPHTGESFTPDEISEETQTALASLLKCYEKEKSRLENEAKLGKLYPGQLEYALRMLSLDYGQEVADVLTRK